MKLFKSVVGISIVEKLNLISILFKLKKKQAVFIERTS